MHAVTRHWKPALLLTAALFMIALAALVPRTSSVGTRQLNYPVIEDFGGVAERQDRIDVPDPAGHYRVIFDVVNEAEDPQRLSPGLMRVARAVNVFAAEGVPPAQLDFVVIIHGSATRSVVNHEVYRRWFGIDNPNAALVEALKDTGVQVRVCGQVLSHWDVANEEVNEDIDITPSALTTLALYGNRGYAYQRL